MDTVKVVKSALQALAEAEAELAMAAPYMNSSEFHRVKGIIADITSHIPNKIWAEV